MRKFFLTLFLLSPSLLAQTKPADWVNERIGTAHEGQTFPSTGMPFAMTAWTPQTRDSSVKCVSPYYDADTKIQGFRGSHFLSGSCTQDYGSLTIMPESGELRTGLEERAASFTHQAEKMSPYHYAVKLNDSQIEAELTGTLRAGIMRFRFNDSQKPWILVQSNAARGDGNVHIDEHHAEITVETPVRRIYAGNGKLAGFSGYFVVQFDHPFHTGGTWTGSQRHDGFMDEKGTEGAPGAYLSFDLHRGDTVQVRIGSSFTSLEEARKNLSSEIPGWSFDEVANRAEAEWNKALGKIEIQTTPEKKRIFYTALYHSMLVPRVFSDVDGSYPGFGQEGKIETAQDFTYYCDFSLWDTFRSLHPLFTILDPGRERDMVKSLIAKGTQGGFLPIYPAWDSYTSEMVGDHAGAVIVDAYVKGIRGFDVNEAYRLMRHNATELPATHELYVDGRGRRGLDSYLKYGYIPLEDSLEDAFHKNEQVSRTLEYAYDDSLVAIMAKALGKQQDYELFSRHAQNYQNVIDPETGFARGRHADGSWVSPFDPTHPASYITEGLPFQYTFFVPQDLPGLMQRVGGREAFIDKLDTLFAKGYYDHGNEPSHHIAYLYDNAGVASKTQLHVRQVMDTQYSDTPAGLAGNDDCGQMSAWYVMSAMGFYPVTPGTDRYQIGTPRFDHATIHLPNGKQLRIQAVGADVGKQYIRAVTLNGKPLRRYWVRQEEIVAGGELVFEMSSMPSTSWPAKEESSVGESR